MTEYVAFGKVKADPGDYWLPSNRFISPGFIPLDTLALINMSGSDAQRELIYKLEVYQLPEKPDFSFDVKP